LRCKEAIFEKKFIVLKNTVILRSYCLSHKTLLLMKTVFSLLLPLVFCTHLIAQDEDPDAPRILTPELGVNFTFFLDEVLDFGGDGGTQLNPYLLTYKNLDEAGTGFRMGVGGNFTQRNSKEEAGPSNDEKVSETGFGLSMRLGKEWHKPLTKRLSWYYGFDGLLGIGVSRTKSEDASEDITTVSTLNRFSGGGGPIVGFEWMITDKIGLFTEGSLYLSNSFRKDKVTFEGTEQDDENFTSNLLGVNFGLPSNIYLFVRF
jgi:hypothetical protein